MALLDERARGELSEQWRVLRLAQTDAGRELLARRAFTTGGGQTGSTVMLGPEGHEALGTETLPPLPPWQVESPPARRGARSGTGSGTRSRARGSAAPAPTGPIDPQRDRVLRAWRAQRAAGKPAYVVFPDSVLAALATAPPRSEDEFLAIKGLGPAKWKAFGPEIIELLGGEASGQNSA